MNQRNKTIQIHRNYVNFLVWQIFWSHDNSVISVVVGYIRLQNWPSRSSRILIVLQNIIERVFHVFTYS